MERTTLQEIFSGAEGLAAGSGKSKSSFKVADTVNATVFAESGSEILNIGQVTELNLAEGHLALTTRKGGRFYVPVARIVGLSVHPRNDSSGDGGGAGFVRG